MVGDLEADAKQEQMAATHAYWATGRMRGYWGWAEVWTTSSNRQQRHLWSPLITSFPALPGQARRGRESQASLQSLSPSPAANVKAVPPTQRCHKPSRSR